jgi:hypothetical protein
MSDMPEDSTSRLDDALRELPSSERDAYAPLVARLRDRPLPSPSLRAAVRAQLVEPSGSSSLAAPRLALAYIGCGFLLLGIAALGLGGLGPLSA